MQTLLREKETLPRDDKGVRRLLRVFPRGLALEIEEIIRTRRGQIPSEIRLRRDRVSSVVIGGRSYALVFRVSYREMNGIMDTLCEGSLYAYRDEISSGFISFGDGIRVGIVGDAGYEGGRLVGVYEVGSLIFRIPSDRCAFSHEVFKKWSLGGCKNLVIIAPPGGGKTTLLRAMAKDIGSGREAKRVVVIDTRREFIISDYTGATVDIQRGYTRAVGIEQAIRTASADVIMVDEIHTADDARAILSAALSGVTVIATAHGSDIDGVKKRDEINDLFRLGVFCDYAALMRKGGEFCFEYGEIK